MQPKNADIKVIPAPWKNHIERLQEHNRTQAQQLKELHMELEVMHDLVQVTTRMLEREIGKDADLEIIRQLSSAWNAPDQPELH